MNSVASTFKTITTRTDMKSMKLNNRERFAILIGIAWWVTLAYYVIHWIAGL